MITSVQDKLSQQDQCTCDQSEITKQIARAGWKIGRGYIHAACDKLIPLETLQRLGVV